MDRSPKSHVLLIHMSWQMKACFITKWNIVYKLWFLFYLVAYQITKSDSRLLSVTLMFCFICMLQGNFFKSMHKKLCTVVDLFTLCSATLHHHCSSNCISVSRLSPSFLSITMRNIQHRPSFQKLVNQPQLEWA